MPRREPANGQAGVAAALSLATIQIILGRPSLRRSPLYKTTWRPTDFCRRDSKSIPIFRRRARIPTAGYETDGMEKNMARYAERAGDEGRYAKRTGDEGAEE